MRKSEQLKAELKELQDERIRVIANIEKLEEQLQAANARLQQLGGRWCAGSGDIRRKEVAIERAEREEADETLRRVLFASLVDQTCQSDT